MRPSCVLAVEDRNLNGPNICRFTVCLERERERVGQIKRSCWKTILVALPSMCVYDVQTRHGFACTLCMCAWLTSSVCVRVCAYLHIHKYLLSVLILYNNIQKRMECSCSDHAHNAQVDRFILISFSRDITAVIGSFMLFPSVIPCCVCVCVCVQGEEKEKEDGEEDEEDNDGFLVPHGYLSDDERDGSDLEQELDPQAAALLRKVAPTGGVLAGPEQLKRFPVMPLLAACPVNPLAFTLAAAAPTKKIVTLLKVPASK